MATHGEAIGAAVAVLSEAGVESPRLDAEVLLAHACGRDRSGVIARLRDPLDDEAAVRFGALVRRRQQREPVAYLTGEREFFSLSFAVTPDVLIPRPETELLVELAIELAPRGGRVCDVGTGSGCIAIALASERPDLEIVACDRSVGALAVAERNRDRLLPDGRIAFVESDLFAGVAGDFDCVVSNPPYVADAAELAPELDWEPSVALRAGAAGMAVVEPLLAGARQRLVPGGAIAVEIGADQEQAAVAAAGAAGFVDGVVRSDLAGLPRVLLARSSNVEKSRG